MKPNVFLVGAAKAGTSALSNFLSQHPEVYMSPIKEPYFFVENRHIETKSEYLQLFKNSTREKVLCEASTGYLYDNSSAVLIKKFCSSAKIIISLRNPIDMAFSFWKYMSIHGSENLPFFDAINDFSNRTSERFIKNCAGRPENYLYIERAKYFEQVKRYYDVFGANSVKVVLFEQFSSEPFKVLQDIFHFLNVEKSFKPNISVINKGGEIRFEWLKKIRNKKYPLLKKFIPLLLRDKIRLFIRDINVKKGKSVRLTSEERVSLYNVFEQDVLKLRKLTGIDLSLWDEFKGVN